MAIKNQYTEENIKSLDWKEHIRMRPGMYIGKLGDGSSPDDGIYILLKEVLDNSIDEFVMGAGKTIEVSETFNESFYNNSEWRWRKRSFTLNFTYRFNQKKNQNRRQQRQNYDDGGAFDF